MGREAKQLVNHGAPQLGELMGLQADAAVRYSDPLKAASTHGVRRRVPAFGPKLEAMDVERDGELSDELGAAEFYLDRLTQMAVYLVGFL